MEVDDVVDLSMATTPSSGISQATARDLQALTQTSGLTITRAPGHAMAAPNAQPESAPMAPAVGAVTDNGAPPVNSSQDNGELEK